MAFAGQLGTADSQLGNIVLGTAGGGPVTKKVVTETVEFRETTARLLVPKIKKVVTETVEFSEGSIRLGGSKKVVTETVEWVEGTVTRLALRQVVTETINLIEDIVTGGVYIFTTLTEVISGMSASLREAAPSTPDPQASATRLDGAAANRIRALLDVERRVPIGVGATVLRAELLIYPTPAWTGTHTLTIAAVDQAWDAATATWNDQPTVRVGAVTKEVTSPAADEAITIDITSLVAQSVGADDASGSRWFGLRLSVDTAGEKSFHSSTAAPDLRPRLNLEWSQAPSAPEDLLPSSSRYVSQTKPTLYARHFDPDAEDTLSGIEIEIDTDDTFEIPLYASGMLNASAPRFSLANPPAGAPVTPTLAVDIDHFWRMRTRDNHGIVSEFSATAQFRVHAKSALTITPAPGGVVSSPTPTTTWAFTGNQIHVEVEWLRRVGAVWETHYAPGKHVGSETSATLPDDFRLAEGETYQRIVRVWDEFDREDLADDRAFVEDSEEVTLAPVVV